MRRLVIALLAACGGKAVAPPPAPPPPADRIAAWLARIPAACRIEPPIPHLTCPAPPPTPADACVVEQRDLETGTVVDRFVFDRRRLIRHELAVSANQHRSIRFEYDALGRQIARTTCMTAAGGGPTWTLPWRPPIVQYDDELSTVDRETRRYATASARVPVSGTVLSTARFDGKVESTEMRVCNTFDERGRRTQRFQVYRMSDRPTAFDTTVHAYPQTKAGPRSMTATTLNLDRRPDGRFDVHFESAWTARFVYDERGLLIAAITDAPSMKNTYDRRGRLIGHDGVAIAWDGDRVVAISGLGPGHDTTYHHDAGGRLVEGRHGPKGGYRVLYGTGCPPDFTHEAIGPNLETFLYYEGKDRL